MSKLLILDNMGEPLSLITYFLETKNYVVKTVHDTIQLFSELSSFQPDLLVLGTLSAHMEAVEICRKLRSRRDTRSLGILLCCNEPADVAKFRMIGADDFIEKPFNLTVLSEKVRSLLSWLPIRRRALGE